jgi:hypothetical protein
VLTVTGFGKINSESLQIHYSHSCLGRRVTVQHPGIDHNYVNQVMENTKLPFFGSHLSEKSPCIAVEQVNITDVAAVHRQLLVMIFLHDSFSSYYIATFVIWAVHKQA